MTLEGSDGRTDEGGNAWGPFPKSAGSRLTPQTAESSPIFQVGWKVEVLKASFPSAARPGPLPTRIITFPFPKHSLQLTLDAGFFFSTLKHCNTAPWLLSSCLAHP